MPSPPKISYGDEQAARSLVEVLPGSQWVAVAIARGFLAAKSGADLNEAAAVSAATCSLSKPKCKLILETAIRGGFLSALEKRSDTGSSINPITKLFPATVTEQRFIEDLDRLMQSRDGVDYSDDRETGHTLSDFSVSEDEFVLPINIKNAGTRFENADTLVGISPDDCIPIPAYKAHAALEKLPNLIYVISIDYELVSVLDRLLPTLFSEHELVVWDILKQFKGTGLRKAEDAFILQTVSRHWETIRDAINHTPFHVVSARKAIKVLQDLPRRTPGIGMRAWGNRASGEVNVHLSVIEDTTPWLEVWERILGQGVSSVVSAINKKRQEWVYDPEI